MIKRILLISLFFVSKIGLPCFNDNVEAWDALGLEIMQAGRGWFEALVHKQKDYLASLEEARQTLLVNKSLPRADKPAVRAYLDNEIQYNKNLQNDFELLTVAYDVLLDYRLSGSTNHRKLLNAITRTLAQGDAVSRREQLVMAIEDCRKKSGHFGYKNAYIDSTIKEFFTLLVELRRFVAEQRSVWSHQEQNKQNLSQVTFKYLDEFSRMRIYINDLFLKVGEELGTYQPTVAEEIKRRRLPEIVTIKKKTKKRTRRHGVAQRSRTDFERDEEREKEGEEDRDVEKAHDEPEHKERDVTDAGENIDANDDEEGEIDCKESRWWMGYEIEKRVAQRKAKEQWRSRHQQVADEKESVPQEEAEAHVVERILRTFAHIKNISLLKHILEPGEDKLKSLKQADLLALLGNLNASVNLQAAGSRVHVNLNGFKTVFHVHGSIGKDTVNSHLRNFLIDGLKGRH